MSRQKLELTWIGKEDRPKLEPRILLEDPDNFFVLAPNLTIYNKLVTDFTPNTPKYVFTGIAEFATEPPDIITGDNYEGKAGTLFDQLLRCKVNVFNISKINSEVRGGKAPRVERLSEYIGESYFEYLANLNIWSIYPTLLPKQTAAFSCLKPKPATK